MSGMYRVCVNFLIENLRLKQSEENVLAAEYLCQIIQNITSDNITAYSQTLSKHCCTNTTSLERVCEAFADKRKIPLSSCVGQSMDGHLSQYNLYIILVMAICIPIGLIGNLSILYAIIKLKCLPRQTGYFLSSLAIADIGIIMQTLFLFISNNCKSMQLPKPFGRFVVPSIDIFLASVSLLQITTISIERAVAVTWPLKYPSYISVKRAKIIVSIIWSVSILLFCYSMSRIHLKSSVYLEVNFYINITLLLIIPTLVVLISYTFVLVCAYQNLSQDRQRMKMLTLLIRTTRNSPTTLHNTTANNNNMDCSTTEKKDTKKFSSMRCREIKLSINLAMIVLPFLGCWGFFLGVQLYEELAGKYLDGVINFVMFILPFTVSSFNPIVYLIFTRSLRNAVKSLIKRNVHSKLSRTELSTVTLSTMNSRRPSSIVAGGTNRKIGRDCSGMAYKSDNDLAECLMKLSNLEQ